MKAADVGQLLWALVVLVLVLMCAFVVIVGLWAVASLIFGF